MTAIPPPPTNQNGFFYQIGVACDTTANVIAGLKNASQSIPIVGGVIVLYLGSIENIARIIGLGFRIFDGQYLALIQAVQNSIDQLQLNTFLDNVLKNAQSLINDPITYLFNFIKFYIDNGWAFLYYPWAWVYDQLKVAVPFLDNFVNTPSQFIFEYIRQLNQQAYDLLVNPYGFIITAIHSISPEISSFLIDPIGFIRNKIQVLFPEVYKFSLDPQKYIFDSLMFWVEQHFEDIFQWLIQVSTKLLNRVW